MIYEKNNVFDSVVHITKERDTKALGKNLLKTLSEFIDYDSLVLFHLQQNSDETALEVTECIPGYLFQENSQQPVPYKLTEQGVVRDNETTQCIQKAETITIIENGTERIIIPIIINDLVTDVLDIHGHKLTDNCKSIIHGFTSIFNNFLSVISDNEHDTLTGLLNRKTFDLRLAELITQAAQKENKTKEDIVERRTEQKETYNWAGILDIDHFKQINDNYGHVFGDEILLLFSNFMKKTFRNNDLLFRYGGEEFVVVLSPISEENATKVFERFRKGLEEFEFPQIGTVTASIGLVKILNQEHPTTVLEHADKALYYAKENGRNRVCNYHQLVESGEVQEFQVESEIEFF